MPALSLPSFSNRAAVVALASAMVLGCVAPPDSRLIRAEFEQRGLGSIERPVGTEFEVPADVDLSDGLSEDEAVAIALWNDFAFRQALADLNVAEADLHQAGLLPNPQLILLFPIDAKQLEGTLNWVLDGLWSRPWRVSSARNAWEATAQRLIESGLRTVAAVRLAFADAKIAAQRSDLERRRAELLTRLSAIAAERSRRGELAELESSSLAANAIRSSEDARRAEQDATNARLILIQSVGADESRADVMLGSARALPEPPELGEALGRALETRPSLLAAKRDLEAAGDRLGWQKRSIIRFTAILDANEKGFDGFEIGPGINLELPIFDRNQAGIERADALLERAAWGYVGERRRIGLDVSRAHNGYSEARLARARWDAQVVQAFGREVAFANAAERSGGVPYTVVIDAEIRKLEAQLRAFDLEAAARRSLIDLEASIGRRLDESD